MTTIYQWGRKISFPVESTYVRNLSIPNLRLWPSSGMLHFFLPIPYVSIMLNNSTEKGSRHYIIIYHRKWNMFENSEKVYMSTKFIHVHVLYICVHNCVYMIVLTLQNSCALQYVCCMLCGESLSVYLWCWGESFAWSIMWHVARRIAVAARLLSLRCEYAIHTSH